MKSFFKSKSFLILISTLLVLGGISIFTFAGAENFLGSIVGFVTTPLQKLTTNVTDSAEEVVKPERSCESYEAEIESLHNEVQSLRERVVNYQELENENQKYKQYLELKEQNKSLKFMPASVVGRSPNEIFYGFTIDQGTLAGISLNDPVITQKGLVGFVSSVGASFSKVTTLLSPESKIGAIDKITRDSGIIIGNLRLSEENKIKFAHIPALSEMKEGNIIVTTGLSGLYPRNLLIGKVLELKNDEFDSSRYAVVEPFEDAREVRDVFVVTDFVGKGSVEMKSISDLFPKEEPQKSTEGK